MLISEVMLQQTPVARVLPIWRQWVERWPQPRDLAAEVPGAAIRAWARLGYPRRALRLHQAATVIVTEHNGQVPSDHAQLLALPGVGGYTAAAVASFAFRQRHAVVDTNVRRVLARSCEGRAQAAPALTRAESALAQRLLPADAERSARWSIAAMELGALICTARAPACDQCPVVNRCAWRLSGSPAYDGPVRRGQPWAGTDRQIRGAILAALRASHGPVTHAALQHAVPNSALRDPFQRDRCIDGLVSDGLMEPLSDQLYRLPG